MTSNSVAAPAAPLAALTAARILLAVVAISHLVVPAVMLLRRADLTADIARRHPDLTAQGVYRSATIALGAAGGFHGALLILTTVLIVLLPRLHPKLLRLTLLSQLASIAFSAVSWRSTTLFHPVIPPLDLVQLIVAGLCVYLLAQVRRGAEMS